MSWINGPRFIRFKHGEFHDRYPELYELLAMEVFHDNTWGVAEIKRGEVKSVFCQVKEVYQDLLG